MSSTIAQSPLSPFTVFRNRDFTLLWLAQFISAMGNGLTTVAASILVFRETGTALSVALMLLVSTAPGLLVGLVAGVFVDRSDRKRVMVTAEILRALLTIAVPLLLPFSVIWLYILVAASSTVKQFFEPAQTSVLPELADEQELAAANSFMTISLIGAEVFGIALAGFIAARFAIVWAFYLDGLSFIISGLFLLMLRVPTLSPQEDSSLANVGQNLLAGIRFVGRNEVIRALLVVFVPVFTLFGLRNSLNLPFIVKTVGSGELTFGLVEGVGLVGFVLGSFLMARYAGRLRDNEWIMLSLLGMSLFGTLYAQLSSVPLLIVTNGGFYLLNALFYIGRQLVLQRGTPRELRGRVSSVFFVTRDTCYMVGMLLAGLGDRFDVRLLMLLSGLGLIPCLGLALALPGLRQSAADWRRLSELLRRKPITGLGRGRPASVADIDDLALHLPSLARIGIAERVLLAKNARVYEVPAAIRIVSQGEASNAAFFLIQGGTVVSHNDEHGREHVLEVHSPGDFFGEIAALTGVPRTASVTTKQSTTLLEVSATNLRQLMADPQLSRVLNAKIIERLARMRLIDLPGYATLDQGALRELRSNSDEALVERYDPSTR